MPGKVEAPNSEPAEAHGAQAAAHAQGSTGAIVQVVGGGYVLVGPSGGSMNIRTCLVGSTKG